MTTQPGADTSQRFWRIFFYLILVGIIIWFVVQVNTILAYFALAGAIAYILNPAVEWLAKKRVPRSLATLLIFVIFAAIVALILMLIIPPALKQFKELIDNFPKYAETIQRFWHKGTELVRSQHLPGDIQSLPDKFAGNLQKVAGKVGLSIFDGIKNSLSSLPMLIVVPILVYYFLADGPAIRRGLIGAVPTQLKPDTEALLSRVNTALGGFIRGQLKLCLVMGIITFIPYLFLLPKYSVIFGLIAGVTEFIPYVGPILALIGPLTVAIFLGKTWLIVAVLIIFVVLQVLEGNFFAPRIIGKDVDLHPAMIMFIMMCGGQLGGIVGMIAAIPVGVTVKALYQFFYVERYLKKQEQPTAPQQ